MAGGSGAKDNDTIRDPPITVVACAKAKNLSQVDRQARQDLIRDMQPDHDEKISHKPASPLPSSSTQPQEKGPCKSNPDNGGHIAVDQKSESISDEISRKNRSNLDEQVSTELKDHNTGSDPESSKLTTNKQQLLKRKSKNVETASHNENENGGSNGNGDNSGITSSVPEASTKSKSKRPKRLGNGVT